MSIARVVVVTKPTALEELARQHGSAGTAEFVITSRGQRFAPYEEEDDAYRKALAEVRRQIPSDLQATSVSREDLPNFLFRDTDLVVICGPDGLFVNAAKYLQSQPVLTVNPDPRSVAGVLMLFSPAETGEAIRQVRAEKHRTEALPFVRASIDGEQDIWAINDILLGRRDQVSARYQLTFASRNERQSSSGVLVSTGVGSTGWLRSIAQMISGIAGSAGSLSSLPPATSNELVFVVREPFPSPSTRTSIVTGRILPGKPLVVSSEMPSGGYIISDGVIERAAEWNAGSVVTVSVGDRHVYRIVR